MDKTELLEALEDSHQELMEMLENLPEETLLTPGVDGDWSIRDILAHLVHWEGQIVTLLFQAMQGMPKPSTAHFAQETVDEINARWHEQGLERSLDMVWSDFVSVRKQTLRRVNEFSDQDLKDPHRFPWLNGKPLWMWVVNDTIEHEEEHADAIRDWLDEQENHSNGSKPGVS